MKQAIIWGASGGIGRATVSLLNKNQWETIGFSRHDDNATVTEGYSVDIASKNSIDTAIYEASFEINEPDLWLYTIGDIAQAKVEECDPDTWQRIINANLTGAYLAAHASLPLLKPDTHMIFIGAINERLRLPSLSAYAAAKAGLEAFIDTFRKEQRKRPVTLFRPGAVDTPFWDRVALKKPKDIATPDQIATRILEAYTEGITGTVDITH